MDQHLLLTNCRIVGGPDHPVHVLLEGPRIGAVDVADTDRVPRFDACGRWLSAGFIDLHVQGAGGADVLDGTPEALATMARALARLGTTGFLGTTVARPRTSHDHLRVVREYTGTDLGGAALLGVHLEGPFINIQKKGGIAPDGIYPSSRELMDELYACLGDTLRMMTIAPELPGNLERVRQLVDHGTVAAFAHSSAGYEEFRKGCDAGITHVTHCFNAMNPMHHREPGPITGIFEHASLTCQIISDGCHVHPAMVRLLHRMVGTDRCACITDGVQGMGLPPGRYEYNGRPYESVDGVARYIDGTLIGTTMGLGEIARRFMQHTGCSIAEAVKTVTIVPAHVLGIDGAKGSVTPGKDADLVLLNDDLSVHATLVGGTLVHMSPQSRP
jgi:N-acetylglucosamine-6-phosphate deacetylase